MAGENKQKGSASTTKEQTKDVKRVEHKNIFDALSAFQGEMKPIAKDGKVNFTTKAGDKVDFEYTTLGKIMEVINPLLGKHGLSVRWELKENGIECIASHATTEEKMEVIKNESGEGVDGKAKLTKEEKDLITFGELTSGMLPLDLKKTDMKEVGAQITYGRRYSLGLVLGIATEEDKDATLIEDKLEKAQNFAFKSAEKGIKNAKTTEEVEKGLDIIRKEVKRLEEGKKTTFGLELPQYEQLIKMGEDKIASFETQVDPKEDKGEEK